MSRTAVLPDEAAAGTRLARAGMVLALATTVAHAGNYVLNLLMARWLSPAEFSDATLMVTLMAVVTALAMGLQMVTARSVGNFEVAGLTDVADRLAGRLRRWAWSSGVALAAVLILTAPQLQQVFHTASAWPFVVLGLGMPYYLAQAVGRGALQGRLAFGRLAVTFLVEMLVRVGVSVSLLALGGGVPGVTAGLTVSFIATWLSVRSATARRSLAPKVRATDLTEIRAYAAAVGLLLGAQIIITNGDVLIAKHFLEPEIAGAYSALSLMGRAAFFLSWSVATVVFPAAARRHAAGQNSDQLLRGGIYAVAGIGGLCALATGLFGNVFIGIFLGSTYRNLGGLLTVYVVSTTLFAVSNLVASHYLATGRTTESWALLSGAVVQTVLLLHWNHSMQELVRAQLVAMTVLVVLVAVCRTARKSSLEPTVERRTSR